MTELPRILKVLIWPFVAAGLLIAGACLAVSIWFWMMFERGSDAE